MDEVLKIPANVWRDKGYKRTKWMEKRTNEQTSKQTKDWESEQTCGWTDG